MQPKVIIIILNWNGWEDTLECLESIYQNKYTNFQVIVVDNGSEDDSIKRIQEYCSGKIKVNSEFFTYKNKTIELIEIDSENCIKKFNMHNNMLLLIKNKKNYGFAEGNNIAIKFAIKNLKPNYMLLLNNDTVVEANFLKKLINVAKDKKIGILGPKINYYNFRGRTDNTWFAGGKINLKKYPGYFHLNKEIINTNLEITGLINCEWISGAGMMVNTEIFHKRLLDNRFFFGAEDVDFCIQAKKEGYGITCVADSIIWHKVSVSRKKYFDKKIKETVKLSYNNLKFIKKNTSSFKFILMFPSYLYQIAFSNEKNKNHD